ncbi:hypothetical protein MMC13_003886 [Lambiella insularis]|nr:hypothetical protein [Lambiella insularis]
MSDLNELEGKPQKPDLRSHTADKSKSTGEQKKPDPAFEPGEKVRMANRSTGIRDWIMTIVKRYEFNEERWGWDYEVKDSNGIPFGGRVPETDLEDA